jgi:hypothetical protein
MSLADLSSRLYTIKSRRNVPFSSAFASMIREDLAMRYSVFNIIRSVTGSEILAQVAEAKYGFKTPLQRDEERKGKLKQTQEKRFKKFTADSLVTLNNKINTLSSLTQRNTALIENLYNDLGSFRYQKKFTKRDLNVAAPKVPIKSRTVKFQIDQIKSELDALQMITIGPKKARIIKKRAQSESNMLFGGLANTAAVGAAAGFGAGKIGGAPGTPGTPDTPKPDESEKGSGIVMGALDAITTYLFGKQLYDWWKGRKAPTAAPVTPATRPLPPGVAVRGTGVVDVKTGKFISKEEFARRSLLQPQAPTATKPAGLISRGFNFVGRLLGTPLNIATAGFIMYDLLTGRTAGKIIKNYEQVAAFFGMKFIKGPGGTTVGYEIDGVKYTPDTLPQEYKNILAAIGPDKRAAAAAQAVIAADESTYRLLETESGRRLVLPPPPTEITDPMLKAAIAGRVALSVSEPELMTNTMPDVTAPAKIETKVSRTKPAIAPAPTPPPSTSSTAPVTVSGIPIDFASYAKRIGALESSNNYGAVNSLGYLGKYQFGALALQDLGLVKKGTSLKGLDNPENWNIEGGKQAFLNDPDLQEKSFIRYTTMNFKTLQRTRVVSVQSPPDQIAGFLAASHLLGPGGARDLMRGKVSTDAYGTKSSKYFAEGVETQKTYLAAITAPPKLEYATGAQVSTPPPPMVASAAPATTTSGAEVTANAALAANKVVQDTVVALAGKVADLDKKSQLDRAFPSVRNAAAV